MCVVDSTGESVGAVAVNTNLAEDGVTLVV